MSPLLGSTRQSKTSCAMEFVNVIVCFCFFCFFLLILVVLCAMANGHGFKSSDNFLIFSLVYRLVEDTVTCSKSRESLRVTESNHCNANSGRVLVFLSFASTSCSRSRLISLGNAKGCNSEQKKTWNHPSEPSCHYLWLLRVY